LVWRFNTIPHPGELGYETWPPDAYTQVGGANVWTGFALDEKRGLVFCPTGAPAFDFWGGNRIGDNLYANCLIALDARTGRRVWHYQFVRHDLWDRDLPAPPNLVTVQHGGHAVDAVAQVTKSGHVFLFDRVTGTPLFPIEQISVPASDLQGEVAATHQPLPTLPEPFSRQVFSYDEITDLSETSHRAVLERFVRVRPHVPFLPPSGEGTIIFPGFDGGAEWGGAAVDPNGILYVNGNEMPWILTMVKSDRVNGKGRSSGMALYNQICVSCHGVDRTGNLGQNVPTLLGIQERLQKSEVHTLLETGRGVMPSFGFLNEAQMESLIAILWGEEPEDSGNEESGEREAVVAKGRGGEAGAIGGIPYSHTGYNRWLDPEGYPAVKPPWGTLNAIDLNTGKFLWRVPLGEFVALSARGIPPTGTENYGGPVVTAGGVIFIAASKDEHIRAFNRQDGRELWKRKLPAGGYATPAVFSVNGRQHVVIACGGGKMGTASGDTYVAFALPE
jgi:quinoprotein glucose dehydrogenase